MAWCKLEDTFCDDPKFRRLAKRLGVDYAQAAGHAACLWSWATRHAPDGNLVTLTADDIAHAAKWDRDPHDFVSACASDDIRLLDVEGDGYEIHGFMQRAESRKAAQRQKKKRLLSVKDRTPVIYVIANGDDKVKIGFTTDLKRRMSEYEQGQSRLLAFFPGDTSVETQLHVRFYPWKIGKSDWFVRSKEISEWIKTLEPVSRVTDKPRHGKGSESVTGERRGEEKERRGETIPSNAPSAPVADAPGYREAVASWFANHEEVYGKKPPWGAVQGKQLQNTMRKAPDVLELIPQFFHGPYPDTIRDGHPLSSGYTSFAMRLDMLRADIANPQRRARAAATAAKIKQAERGAATDDAVEEAKRIMAAKRKGDGDGNG